MNEVPANNGEGEAIAKLPVVETRPLGSTSADVTPPDAAPHPAISKLAALENKINSFGSHVVSELATALAEVKAEVGKLV